jgi:Tfp pilus assembly protein PilP
MGIHQAVCHTYSSLKKRLTSQTHILARGGVFLLAGLLLLLLAGCAEQSRVAAPQPSQKKGPAGDSSAKVKEFEKRLEHLLRPIDYRYSTKGKPDPFQPFLKTNFEAPKQVASEQKAESNEGPPERCATALECIDVGQLKLVAIVTREDGNRDAMAQDAAGIGYVLSPGVRVGYRSGTVKIILKDRVVVAEESEDIRGQKTIQERLLVLHPEEQ